MQNGLLDGVAILIAHIIVETRISAASVRLGAIHVVSGNIGHFGVDEVIRTGFGEARVYKAQVSDSIAFLRLCFAFGFSPVTADFGTRKSLVIPSSNLFRASGPSRYSGFNSPPFSLFTLQ
jgi:hypothetical protein